MGSSISAGYAHCRSFYRPVHGKPGLADRITGRKRFRGFRTAWIEGDKGLALIDRFYRIVDAFRIVALVGKKGALFREASPPGCRSGQREVRAAEKLVVKRSGAFGCEQCHILNDFLSVDSGHPLSGWCVSQIHFTQKGLRFLYHLSDFRFQPWPGTIEITAFPAFCSWLI